MSRRSKKASRELLNELFNLLLVRLIEKLGKPEVKASMMAVALELLKSCGVTAAVRDQIEAKRGLEQLKQEAEGAEEALKLPFPAAKLEH